MKCKCGNSNANYVYQGQPLCWGCLDKELDRQDEKKKKQKAEAEKKTAQTLRC